MEIFRVQKTQFYTLIFHGNHYSNTYYIVESPRMRQIGRMSECDLFYWFSRVFVTILKLLQFIAINVIENNSIMVCIKMSNEIWFTWVNRAKDAP